MPNFAKVSKKFQISENFKHIQIILKNFENFAKTISGVVRMLKDLPSSHWEICQRIFAPCWKQDLYLHLSFIDIGTEKLMIQAIYMSLAHVFPKIITPWSLIYLKLLPSVIPQVYQMICTVLEETQFSPPTPCYPPYHHHNLWQRSTWRSREDSPRPQ